MELLYSRFKMYKKKLTGLIGLNIIWRRLGVFSSNLLSDRLKLYELPSAFKFVGYLPLLNPRPFKLPAENNKNPSEM